MSLRTCLIFALFACCTYALEVNWPNSNSLIISGGGLNAQWSGDSVWSASQDPAVVLLRRDEDTYPGRIYDVLWKGMNIGQSPTKDVGVYLPLAADYYVEVTVTNSQTGRIETARSRNFAIRASSGSSPFSRALALGAASNDPCGMVVAPLYATVTDCRKVCMTNFPPQHPFHFSPAYADWVELDFFFRNSTPMATLSMANLALTDPFVVGEGVVYKWQSGEACLMFKRFSAFSRLAVDAYVATSCSTNYPIPFELAVDLEIPIPASAIPTPMATFTPVPSAGIKRPAPKRTSNATHEGEVESAGQAGLTTGQKAGIGIAACVGAVALCGAVAIGVGLFLHRRAQKKEEQVDSEVDVGPSAT